MGRLLAFAAITVLASCSSEPTLDDQFSVMAAALNTLYAQIDQDVSAVGICRSGHTNAPPEVFAKVNARSIPVVQCSSIDFSKPAERLHVMNSTDFAVALSADKVTFDSSTSATVVAHYSYGSLAAAGFTFILGKTTNGWSVIKQNDLWVS